MENDFLYLASASKSRKLLLEKAGIPFKETEHRANESSCTINQPPKKLVEEIALLKMDHAVVPENASEKKEVIYVLTADTLTVDKNGRIFGKPKNMDRAIKVIKALSHFATAITSFCLERRIFSENQIKVEKRIVKTVESSCECIVPESYLEKYIEKTNALNIAGALSVENYGAMFVKSINGSYTNILGLPMYELREALEKTNFKF